MFFEVTREYKLKSREAWGELLLRAATWKRREFFRFWNEIQGSDLNALTTEEKWNLIFERLQPLRPIQLPSEIRFISFVDVEYPEELFELPQPPLGLFVCGEFAEPPYFSIVGSRKPLPFTRRVTLDLATRLATLGYTIVSGGALGIDGAAHEAAIRAGGRTIVVLGSGIRRLYPRSHENLFSAIVKNGGTLISEYAPFVEPKNYHFPERNRIIAALSSKLFLAQAHAKSGSLLTARTALDMGKDIYVLRPVPGDSNFAGSQDLIDAGARSVIDAEDLEIEALR